MTETVPNLEKGFLVRTFYLFTDVAESELTELQDRYLKAGREMNLCGSLLLATEGCNATISGRPDDVERFFALVSERFPGLTHHDSVSDRRPYQRFKVPLKRQIVQARDTELSPPVNHQAQKSADEWDEIRRMVREGTAQMIDVRNSYEIEIGTFPEAIDPATTTFKEFSDYLDREVGESLDPDTPTAIFCTGGIRCEKARLDLERRGFSQVWQLNGGILRYLSESPEPGFEGECFVFDERVAVDRRLAPSANYSTCPQCGGPLPKNGGEHTCFKGENPTASPS